VSGVDEAANGTTRKQFLQSAGLGALAAAGGGGLAYAARHGMNPFGAAPAGAATVNFAIAATDGHVVLPNLDHELFIFGFRPVPVGASIPSLISAYKGTAQLPAPVLDFRQGDDVLLTMTNLGFVARPDLTDGHTVHWHGFRTPSALYDGVPEVSIAVPMQRQFTYFYRPHDPGTYMWHCHFEDVEHVQMGMTSIVFVRPVQGDMFAYNDGDGSTAFHRHFALLLNEIWQVPHDNSENIQETIFTDYDPNFWTINGRCYPDTVKANVDGTLPNQRVSSLMQCNPGERVLMRLANLGYQQHAMQLPGIPMRVVGEDAVLLRNPAGPAGPGKAQYSTNTVYIGPGEARDVIFVAPAYSTDAPVTTDAHGQHNTYLFKNRDFSRLNNNGAPGLGGMVTEVRVYNPSNPVPATTQANQTYRP
jgi:FtsP/CotA-like multicopper oxidase with cupredoxin domain